MDSEKPVRQWTVLSLLAWTQSYFQSHAIDSPRLTAEMLLCHCLGLERLDLYLQFDRPLNPGELAAYRALVARRVRREPVAYITGTKGFWELELDVTPDVLIPRPDTETLVEAALGVLAGKVGTGRLKVLELGVGSGAVILSLSRALAHAGIDWYATDLSLAAIRVAMANLRKNPGVPSVHFLAGSWFSAFKKGMYFDLVVSNPPYIPSADINGLEPEILYEPRLALDGGPGGLDCIRQIVCSACDHMMPGAVMMLEMGFDQKNGVSDLVRQCGGYEPVEFLKDFSGHYRVAVLKKKIANTRAI
ncbi:MAG: peptide chain release factor N(5)-glutamine methyltransferase [Pseudomonadota bacterium]